MQPSAMSAPSAAEQRDLRGTLAALDLAELLQLLAHGGKTGALVVDDGRVRKRIYLERGAIVCASSSDPREHLRRYLLRERLVSRDVLGRAERLRRERGLRLGRGLLELRAVPEAELVRVIRLKVAECCCELFRWSDGQFRFVRERRPPGGLLPVSLDVTAVVLEGMHQLDDWKRGIDRLSFRGEASRPVAPRPRPSGTARPSRRGLALAGTLILVLIAAGAPVVWTGSRPVEPPAPARVDGFPRGAAAPAGVSLDPEVLPAGPGPGEPVPEAARLEAEIRGLRAALEVTRRAAAARAVPVVERREAPAPAAPPAPRRADGLAAAVEEPVTALPAARAPEPVSQRPAAVPGTPLLAPLTPAREPRLLSMPGPRYPPLAERLRRSATVSLRVRLDGQGRVQEVEPLGADPGHGFRDAAVEAARRSLWEPGEPGTWGVLRVEFRPRR